jgi:butyryl-CoA dehydrogenase
MSNIRRRRSTSTSTEQHSKETFDLYIDSVRRFARQDLLPTYKPMDEEPPVFRDGRIHTHPALPALFEQMVDLGVLTASRPESVGGQQLPMLVHTMASAYLMAANLGAYGFVGLTVGAGHLIEAFGTDELKERFMTKMYAGEWTGTMALTEPQAGSSMRASGRAPWRSPSRRPGAVSATSRPPQRPPTMVTT